MTTASATRRRKKLNLLSCFNIVLFLIAVQLTTLFSLGFFSVQIHFQTPHWAEDYLGPWFLDDDDDAAVQDDDLLQMEGRLSARKKWKDEKVGQNNKPNDTEKDDDDQTSRRNEGGGTTGDGSGPIDDYHTRAHIRKQVPLVVGGSDGSGTRAFVDVLGKLGVPMLVDDPGTMDIHASSMFLGRGWPPLASAVLVQHHSPNYEFRDLSEKFQEAAKRELGKLKGRFQVRLNRLMRKVEMGNETDVASSVSFGFKAPVTMLLVPMLQEVFGPIKYLHVVRDGRDVCLSDNQSPVKKFYNDTYPDHKVRDAKLKKLTKPVAVKGMQLWNDWNTALYSWEKQHNNGVDFDFVVMRTEDLLDPVKKFESLLQLADFVGSPLSTKDLCCLSRKAIVDMGKSKVGAKRFSEEKLRRFDQARQRYAEMAAKSQNKTPEEMTTMDSLIAMQELRTSKARAEYREKRERKREKLRLRREEQGERETIEDWRVRYERNRAVDSRDGNGDVPSMREALRGWRKKHRDFDGSTRRRLLSLLERQHNDRRRPGRRDPNHLEREVLRLKARLGRAKEMQDLLLEAVLMDKLEKTEFALESAREQLEAEAAQNKTESTGHKANATGVSKRYGKWVDALQNEPKLSHVLHKEGANGLATFGYEPTSRFMDYSSSADNFVCNDEVVCS